LIFAEPICAPRGFTKSGLDHVLASGKNVKILVPDTEVYSNTGGQIAQKPLLSLVKNRFSAIIHGFFEI